MKKFSRSLLFDLIIMGLYVVIYLSSGFEVAAIVALANIHLALIKK